MTPNEKKEKLTALAAEIAVCRNCKLCEQRTQTVPGGGNPNAEVLFIGEAPGKAEDLQGVPFVGAAGKFLDQMLVSIKWTRNDIFIANVCKCRPPNNRDPKPEEIKACWNFLTRQIEIINPKLIVTLGRHSMNRFLPNFKISNAHGKPVRRKNGQLFLPLYHPAAALYSPSQKEVHLADFAKISKILNEIAQTISVESPH